MIIFIGDKPSPRMKPGAKPFDGAKCEKRLKEWIAYLVNDKPYEIYNACDIDGKMFYIETQVFIIALGNNASKAIQGEHFKLPHPSRLNRQLNDKEFIANRLKLCKDWLTEKGTFR